MSFNTDQLNEFLEKFREIQNKISLENVDGYKDEEKTQQRTHEIIEAYNNIIRHTSHVWLTTNTHLREYVKNKLTETYYKLKDSLKILKVDIELPTNLNTEIILKHNVQSNSPTTQTKETQTDKEQNAQEGMSNKENNETQEDILQSTIKYDTEILQALLDEFDEWDKKITRKNASEKEEVIELRTNKIINAYNKLVEFITPIINKDDDETTKNLRDELTKRKDYISDDLQILNSNARVPDNITEKIKTDQTNKNNDDKMDENKTDVNKHKKNNSQNKISSSEYYKMCNQQLNYTYMGDPLGLPPLIDAIELLQFMDDENSHENILLRVLRTKLKGTAREYLPRNATIAEIKEILQRKIKVKNSKIITGQLMALKADKTNFTEYATRAEDLAEQFNRSLILENVPSETANAMTIEKTIDLCTSNTRSQIVKSVLESTKFDDPKEVIATYIIQERKHNPNETQVLAFQQTNRFNRNRNFGNAQRYQRNGYQNNNYRNNFRPNRHNFNRNTHSQRGHRDNRGRGHNRGYHRGGQYRGNRHNIRYAENNESPPPGGNQTQNVEIHRAEQ